MPVYKLQKKNRSGRRVAVRADRIEWNLPAGIICLLLAFAIWLYVVNFTGSATEEPPAESAATPEAVDTVPAGEMVGEDDTVTAMAFMPSENTGV